MHVVYKITYIPHLNTEHPKYYIGSKYNYKPGYFGSVASKQVYDYTDGMYLKDWWKIQKQCPENFIFEILEIFDDITPDELIKRELLFQQQYNVLSEDFFNHSLATVGFCGAKRGEVSRKLISQRMKDFWASGEGQEKRERLIERNQKQQSTVMLEKWKDPSDKMIEYRARLGKNTKSDETKLKMSIARRSKLVVEYNGIVYNGWKDLYEKTGVTKYMYKTHYKG